MSRKGSVAVSGCALFHRLHHHYCCCRCPSVASQHSVQLRPFTGGTVGQLTPELSTLPWSVDSWKTENDAWTWCLSVDRAIIVIISIYYITKNYTVTTELNLYHYYYDYYMRGNIYLKKKNYWVSARITFIKVMGVFLTLFHFFKLLLLFHF